MIHRLAIPLPKINELLAEADLPPVSMVGGKIVKSGHTRHAFGPVEGKGMEEAQYLWIEVEYPWDKE
mgnify:CR=1 FL=1